MLSRDIIFGLSNIIITNSFNQNIFNQISVEELIREEEVRLLKQVVENNQKILELQKQLAVAMKMNAERKRREQDREYMRRDYKER